MVTNFFTLWPLLMTAIGARLAWLLLRRPKPKDRHWWVWLSLAFFLLHHFEETGWDILGRPFSTVTFVCGKLGFYRAEVALCPATYPFFFALHLIDTWLLTIAAVGMGPRRPLAGATAIAVPLVDAAAHVLLLLLGPPRYSPGLVTAVLLTAPLGLLFLSLARSREWLAPSGLLLALLGGALAQLLLWGALAVAAAGRLSAVLLPWAVLPVGLLPLVALWFKRIPLVKMYDNLD